MAALWNAANLLTILRLAAVPPLVWALLAGRPQAALAIFAAAAASDGLDGWLARRFGLETRAGAYLDPLADKLLMAAVYLALAAAGQVAWWLVILIFGRDLLILSGVGLGWWVAGAREFPPSVWGKISTFFQAGYGLVLLCRAALGWPFLLFLADWGLWPVAAMTVVSGVHYTGRALSEWRHAWRRNLGGSAD